MRFIFALVLVALRNLLRQRARSLLTMLGIIIAVAAVMVMGAIGEGGKQRATAWIQKLGTNLLHISPQWDRRKPVDADAIALDLADAQAIAELEDVTLVVPMTQAKALAKYGDRRNLGVVRGTTELYEQGRSLELYQGSFLSGEALRLEAVLGATIAMVLFSESTDLRKSEVERDVVGDTIRINGKPFVVRGVVKRTGGGDIDDAIFVPLAVAQKRLFGVRYLTQIMVRTSTSEVVAAVQEAIDQLLFIRHGLVDEEKKDFRIGNMAEVLEAKEEVRGTFTNFLLSVAGIALLVGGIGIMNIMLVSVTERTREIGICKAVGARNRHIMLQFLVEAVVLTSLGGLIGLAVGVAGTYGFKTLMEWDAVINWPTTLVALASAVATGLFFGLYPARRAARLSPIDALRHE